MLMSFDDNELVAIASVFKAVRPNNKVLTSTLNMILETSVHSTTSVPLMAGAHFAILNGIIELFRQVGQHREIILSILVNVSAADASLAAQILSAEDGMIIKFCVGQCQKKDDEKTQMICVRCSQLLANLSRHHAHLVYNAFEEHWRTNLSDIFEMLLLSTSNEAERESRDYIGYLLMNLSTLPKVRESIAKVYLPKLLPLLASNVCMKRRFCAVNVVYNLSFDDHLHRWLLEESSISVPELIEDQFLVAIVAPLADKEDALSDEEIEWLPLDLQYYDGCREKNTSICRRLVETLYQLCATRFGREKLRAKGVYALMREFDKSRRRSGGGEQSFALSKHLAVGGWHTDQPAGEEDSASSDAALPPQKSDEQSEETEAEHHMEAVLHALIGILIRVEEEMGVADETFSLRHLKVEEQTEEPAEERENVENVETATH